MNMNTKELNRLLEKYYSGESTGEEERDLKVFFNGNDIPEGYEAEKALFGYFMAVSEVQEPSSAFEARILTGIDGSEKNTRSRRHRRFVFTALGTAAGILMLAGSYFFFVNRSEPRDTFSDPKLAYAETMKILMDVSSQLNRGTMALEPVTRINDLKAKSFDAIIKSTKTVQKNLKNLDYLQKAIEITNETVEKSTNKK
jgi:hypothetical protein